MPSGSGFGILICTGIVSVGFIEITKSDLPICEKEIAEEYPVGDKDSREELEELGLFGPDWKRSW